MSSASAQKLILISIVACFIGCIADVLLLYSPVGKYESGDYQFLNTISEDSLFWGHYLGIFFIPFELLGFWVISRTFINSDNILSAKWANTGFAGIGFLMCIGVAYHGMIAFVAAILREASNGAEILDNVRNLFEPFGAILAVLFFVFTSIACYFIWKRKSTLPSWVVFFNPIFIYLLLVLCYKLIPSIGNYLIVAGFNFSNGVFLLACFFALNNRNTESKFAIKNGAKMGSIILVFFSSSLFGNAQDTVFQNKAFVWNGFKHSWTYNHRINRLGDFIKSESNAENQTAKTEHVHASASGLGADSSFFQSAYCKLENENMLFNSGKEVFNLNGKEGSLLKEKRQVVLPIEPQYLASFENKDLTVLLNGFDLFAIKKADKIQLFKINIDDPVYSEIDGEITFTIEIALVVDCQSLECNQFKHKTDYIFEVHYLLIVADEKDMHLTKSSFSEIYDWDKKEELTLENKNRSIKGLGNDFTEACLGIRSISMILDQEHWLLEWNNYVSEIDYNPESGNCNFAINLLFKEWAENMKSKSEELKQSKFALKKMGWANLETELLLLQFNNTKVEAGEINGGMYWKGGNEAAFGNKAATSVNEIK